VVVVRIHVSCLVLYIAKLFKQRVLHAWKLHAHPQISSSGLSNVPEVRSRWTHTCSSNYGVAGRPVSGGTPGAGCCPRAAAPPGAVLGLVTSSSPASSPNNMVLQAGFRGISRGGKCLSIVLAVSLAVKSACCCMWHVCTCFDRFFVCREKQFGWKHCHFTTRPPFAESTLTATKGTPQSTRICGSVSDIFTKADHAGVGVQRRGRANHQELRCELTSIRASRSSVQGSSYHCPLSVRYKQYVEQVRLALCTWFRGADVRACRISRYFDGHA
jgi:hypothetical protein